MIAGELVKFTRPAHLLDHVWEFRRAIDRVGKALRLHDELRKLDFVEVAGTVGQLHARLESAVALSGLRHLPNTGGVVLPFDREGLAASAPRRRHRRQRRITRDQPVERNGRDDVDQRIEPGSLLQVRQRHRLQRAVESGFATLVVGGRTVRARLGLRVRLGLFGRVAPSDPGTVRDQGRQHHAAGNGQADLE